MKKYQVNVIGGKPPKRPHSFIRRLHGYAGRALAALPLRAGALVLAGSAGFASFIGTPHVGWEYQCGQALWSIIVSFVELGFGVHPLQEVCGKDRESADASPKADFNRLGSPDSEPKLNLDGLIARLEAE